MCRWEEGKNVLSACLPVCSVHLFVLSTDCPSTRLFSCLPFCLFLCSVHRFVCLPLCLSLYSSVCLSTHLSTLWQARHSKVARHFGFSHHLFPKARRETFQVLMSVVLSSWYKGKVMLLRGSWNYSLKCSKRLGGLFMYVSWQPKCLKYVSLESFLEEKCFLSPRIFRYSILIWCVWDRNRDR